MHTTSRSVGRRSLLAAVMVFGACFLPVLPVLQDDPIAHVVGPLWFSLLMAEAVLTRFTRTPLRLLEVLAWTTGAAGLGRQVLVSSPDHLGFHAMAMVSLLAAGAFYLWPRRAAAVATVGTTAAAAAFVGARADAVTVGFLVAYGIATLVLCSARAATASQLEVQQQLALADDLTGIANRRALTVHVRASLARQLEGAPADALMLLDIDHFKQINDTLGHDRGDEVLRDVARIAARIVGEDGVVGRWGGEEFAILVDTSSPEAALAIANSVRLAISARTPVTVSIGIARYDHDGTVRGWFASADHAMYQAKAGGRDQVVLDNPAASGLELVAAS